MSTISATSVWNRPISRTTWAETLGASDPRSHVGHVESEGHYLTECKRRCRRQMPCLAHRLGILGQSEQTPSDVVDEGVGVRLVYVSQDADRFALQHWVEVALSEC